MDPRTYTHMQYGFPVHSVRENRILPTTGGAVFDPPPPPGVRGLGRGRGGCVECGTGGLFPDVPEMTDKQKTFTATVAVASGVGGLVLGGLLTYFAMR